VSSAVASSGAQTSTTSTYPLGVTMSTRQGTWSDDGMRVAMRHSPGDRRYGKSGARSVQLPRRSVI
jgi:hypothetical protein